MDYIQYIRKQVGNNKIILNAAGAVIVKDNKVLYQHRKDNGKWGIIGGILELDETYEEACIREIKEETGLDVKLEYLLGIFHNYDMKWPSGDMAHVIGAYYVASVVGGNLQVDDESLELVFCDKEHMPPLFAKDHKEAVKAYYDGVKLPLLLENKKK